MEARLDKWLWAARIFKTRSIAIDACKNGRVMMNDQKLKPSRMIKEGDVIQVRKPPVTYSFRVLQAIQNRVGAKLVPTVLENLTPPDQYELLEMNRISGFVDRARGTGRPTKKDRRSLDDFVLPAFYGDFDFDDDDDDDENGEDCRKLKPEESKIEVKDRKNRKQTTKNKKNSRAMISCDYFFVSLHDYYNINKVWRHKRRRILRDIGNKQNKRYGIQFQRNRKEMATEMGGQQDLSCCRRRQT